MNRMTAAALFVTAVLASACGGAEAATDSGASEPTPALGICLEGATDCVDMVPGEATDDGGGDAIDEGAILAEAEALLGVTEDEALARSDVRLGRHGDEHLAVTDDYVIGRMTVATDDDGTGTYHVVEVTVELTEGPHTLTTS